MTDWKEHDGGLIALRLECMKMAVELVASSSSPSGRVSDVERLADTLLTYVTKEWN